MLDLGAMAGWGLSLFLESKPPAKLGRWHYSQPLGASAMIMPADGFEKVYIEPAVETLLRMTEQSGGEGVRDLPIPPGVAGGSAEQDGWKMRVIVDFDLANDIQVLRLDLARLS